MKIDHIGYAVKNIDSAMRQFEKLGYSAVAPKYADQQRQINVAFMRNGDYVIELLSPLSASSPITTLLNKIGNAPYHVCYEVERIDEEMEQLRAAGYMVIEAPSVSPAMGGRRAGFVTHKDVGIVELVEGAAPAT